VEAFVLTRACQGLSTTTLGKGPPLVQSCTPANTITSKFVHYPPPRFPSPASTSEYMGQIRKRGV
jgi:hypothetical protein